MTARARRIVTTRRLVAAPVVAASVLLALAAPASAETPDGVRKLPRIVSVSGVATREVTPDMAVITIGVSNRSKNAAEALAANSAAATKVIEAVRKAGLEARDVRTDNVSITPNYRNRRDSSGAMSSEEDGFTVSNTVTIRVRDLARLGPLLTAAAGEGANRINNLSFDFSGRSKVQEELQAEAVRNARATAQRLVEAAGAKLGQLQSIGAGHMAPRPYDGMKMMRAAAPAAEAVPVEAGEMTLSATVQTSWTIE